MRNIGKIWQELTQNDDITAANEATYYDTLNMWLSRLAHIQ